MKNLKLASVLILLLTSGQLQANCTINNRSFKNGESLKYKISYKLGSVWITAGYATFSVQQTSWSGKSAFHIVGQGSTTSNFDKIFKVRDKYESYISVYNLLPYQFIRNVSEGEFKTYNNVRFNQQNKTARSTNGNFTTTNCVHDVLSAIYLARNIEFEKMKPGSKAYINLFLDDKLYKVYVKYLGKETIKTSRGMVRTLKIQPQLIAGTVFDESNAMILWVSDDKNQVPVRVKSAITVGSVIVDLTSYQNLRNPSVLK